MEMIVADSSSVEFAPPVGVIHHPSLGILPSHARVGVCGAGCLIPKRELTFRLISIPSHRLPTPPHDDEIHPWFRPGGMKVLHYDPSPGQSARTNSDSEFSLGDCAEQNVLKTLKQ